MAAPTWLSLIGACCDEWQIRTFSILGSQLRRWRSFDPLRSAQIKRMVSVEEDSDYGQLYGRHAPFLKVSNNQEVAYIPSVTMCRRSRKVNITRV